MSLNEAIEGAPTLARLAHMVDQSTAMLKCVQVLIPPALREHIKAGPVEGSDWCLMVSSNAAAAKLRQLVPLLRSRLQNNGWSVLTLRIKIIGQR